MKRNTLVLMLCALSGIVQISCSPADTGDDYPVFWTWMEDREGLDLDSLFVHMTEAGIDGLMLYVPDADSYRKAAALARENDVTLYAWIWTLRPRGDRDRLLKVHPDWFDCNRMGKSLVEERPYLDTYAFLSAAVPEVREYVRENVRQVCQIDGIEGICLDYCRIVDRILPVSLSYKYEKVHDSHFYPEYDYGYHPEALKRFETEFGYNPMSVADPTRDSLWCAFRERMITEVANIAAEVAHSYGKKVCASPFVSVELASVMVGQNYSQWDLDLVFPMVYSDFYSMEPGFVYDAMVRNMENRNPQTEIFCGLGAELGGTYESLLEDMDAAFSAGASGISLYTVAGLDTSEKRAGFKAYADNIREMKRDGRLAGMPRPDYVPVGGVSLDPFTHPRLMHQVERAISRLVVGENIRDRSRVGMNGIVPEDPDRKYPEISLTDYEMVQSDDRILIYRVKDQISGRTFDVLFPIYGKLISGWDVRPVK